MQEKIIETKTCKHCNSSFEITDKDLEFYEKVSPTFGGKKYTIPTPTLCPDCRQQRRLLWRNESKLYKRTCNASGRDIISIYSPDKPHKIYEKNIWQGDNWDALSYGKDFNFNKTFSEQFKELQLVVPRMSLLNGIGDENSNYTNHGYYQKDCYLCFETGYIEKCIYSTSIKNSTNCVDCEICLKSENCYDCQNIANCNKCFFSEKLTDSFNCYNCFDCIGCKNCYGCSNLVNKEYYLFNKKVSKEEFEDYLNKNKGKKVGINNKIVKNLNIINSEDCLGDNLTNSKNSKYSYDCSGIDNVNYSWKINDGSKNCYDFDIWGENAENIYEVHCTGGNSYNIFFSNVIWLTCNDIYYSDNCISSSNLFGCIGLSNKSYCILNKEYSKEEYEKLIPKIIQHMMKTGEWGEFFPVSISPFGYNETVAEEYFPLNKNEALEKGFNRSEYEPPFPKVDKIIKASMLPENISDIPDDILNWAIECEVSRKPFRIVKAELEFYRKHNLPIPKRHPDQRHLDRLALRNPRKLFDRKCDKCGKDIKTTYAPDRKEIVYCESCYEKEVY